MALKEYTCNSPRCEWIADLEERPKCCPKCGCSSIKEYALEEPYSWDQGTENEL